MKYVKIWHGNVCYLEVCMKKRKEGSRGTILPLT